MITKAQVVGTYSLEVLENDVIIARTSTKNLLTTEGVNKLWDSAFGGSANVTTWYLGLIDSVPTPALQITDTLASTPGWNELAPGSDYTGNRKQWVTSAASSRTMTSSANAVFDILTTKTVYGAFLTSEGLFNTGTLMSEGAFSQPISVNSANTINLTYSIQML